MNLFKVKIKSKRIKLVPTSDIYAQEMHNEFTPEITKYMMPKALENIEETHDYLKTTKSRMEKGDDLILTILKNENNEYLGQCGIHKLKSLTPSFGIWIKKSAHGNNYGKEAIQLAKDWCDKNLNYKYITYPVDKRNIGSRKIAESLNGVIKKDYKTKNESGFMLDEVEYWIYPK